MEREAIVLLENRQNTLPLNKERIKTLAVIGPQADRVSVGVQTNNFSEGPNELSNSIVRRLCLLQCF